MNQTVIQLSGLTKRYGQLTAVDRLDLSIRKGEVFGLLGPNGAGKSTTILMILGLTEPSGGTVKVCGIDSTINPIEVKRKVGYLPDEVGFYDNRSGLENLLYTAGLNRIAPAAARLRATQLLQQVGLADTGDKKTGAYSRGMRQRLGLADVLIKSPEIIILDEPTLGIDPKGVREFLRLIVQLSREEGITVLLSSHHLHQVQQVCDRVGLFVGGRLLAEGNIATLSAQLFAGEPFIIEAGIADPPSAASQFPTAADPQESLPEAQPASADPQESLPEAQSASADPQGSTSGAPSAAQLPTPTLPQGSMPGAQAAASADPPTPTPQALAAASHPAAQFPDVAPAILHLQQSLQLLEGVNSVRLDHGMFRLGCSHDATTAIARTIVTSGFGLTHLQKKEYGLDDIYNRYFEGGQLYEQTA